MPGRYWETAQLNMYGERACQLGAQVFAPDAWSVLLAISEAQAGANFEQLRRRIGSTDLALDRWLHLLEHRQLIRPVVLAQGPGGYSLTSKAQGGLANLREIQQHSISPDWDKIQVLVNNVSVN